MRRALPLIALALLVAGCGGSSKPAGPAGGAEVAPSSTEVFVRAKTDAADRDVLELVLGLAAVDETLDRARVTLLDALGPETDVAVLDGGGVVGLTRPENAARLQTALTKNDPPLVSEVVAGWTVVAENRRAIDRFKEARNDGTLASSDLYEEATTGLPAQAAASVYASGEAAARELGKRLETTFGPIPGFGRVDWVAGAVTRQPEGLDVHLRVKGDEIEVSAYTAELPAEAPAPVSLLVDEKGLDATLDELKRSPALTKRLGSLAQALGSGLLDDVIELFRGEAALYARPLPDGPEYTLLLKIEDDDRANQVLDRLSTLVGAAGQTLPEHPRIAGVLTTKILFQDETYYYAVLDGKVVLTTAPSGIRGLVREGTRLTETQGWQSAAQAAALPEETAGLAYFDGQRAIPLVQTLLGEKPQDGVSPLGTGMLWASVDGAVLSVRGFVSVR